MSKKTVFDGKEGSFGRYGGTQVKFNPTGVYTSTNTKGYWQKVCSVDVDGIRCVGKALYHTGGDGYCEAHKGEAVKRRLRYRDRVGEMFLARLESETQEMVEFDDLDLSLLKARKYPSTKPRTSLVKESTRDLSRKAKAKKG